MTHPLVLLPLLFPLLILRAHAMCVHETYQPVAWNSSGRAVLIHLKAAGPEGGGSDSYIVVDFDQQKGESFTVSSNFSPGNGSTPERISKDECKAAAAAANKTLSRLGFAAKFKDGFFSCMGSRADLLTGVKGGGELLPAEKAVEAAAKSGVASGQTAPVLASKDGVRFVLVSENSSCSAKCHRITLDLKDQGFKKGGECL